MPIYCLNSTTYASRKRSKNALIHELIGDHNYYLSSGTTCAQGHHHHHHPHHHHNLSMASYHILMSRQQQALCKSSSTSSLMVTIDRFKEAVSNMKQTVLVPTLLDALAGQTTDGQFHPHHCYSHNHNNCNGASNGNSGISSNNNNNHYSSSQQLQTSSILEVEEVDTDSACSSDHCSSNNDSGNEGNGGSGGGNTSRPKSSLSWTTSASIPQQPQNSPLISHDEQTMVVATLQQQQQPQPPLTMAASLGQHNLYEQYKLLDMIDSILSSDISYMSSRQRYQHQLLFGSASANANSSSSSSSVLLHFPAENNNDDNNNCPAGNSKSHQCCLQMLKTGNGGGQQMEESPGELSHQYATNGEYHHVNQQQQQQPRSGHPKLTTPVNGHRSALLGGKLDGLVAVNSASSNGHHQQEAVSPTMEDGSDQAFVASSDSHCSLLKIKDKLEYHLVSLKSILNLLSNTADCITSSYLEGIQCEDHFDSRQLTSTATGKGASNGVGSELTDFQSPLSSTGNNGSSSSSRHYYTSN